MSDLISREKLLNEINLLKKSPWYNKDFAAVKLVRKDAVAIVEKCVEEAPSVAEWISVKDRMPDRKDYEWLRSGERRLVIFVCGVIHGYRDVVLGSYSYASKQWTDLYGEKIDDVTHWMPLPEPPKENNNDEF